MKTVIVETSARHIHLTREHVDILFGKGYQLTSKKALSQPGQFACVEKVKLEGPKSTFPGVSILGPERKKTQIEVSLTDARTLGISAPVRESGHVEGSGACKLTGPCGELELSEGVIVAKRHFHCTPEDAKVFGVTDGQIISIKVTGGDRSLTFGDVVARVASTAATAVHIDTDEANAAGISGEVQGEVIL